MRTARLDLDLSGTRLRVLCRDGDVADMLRGALHDSIIDEPCEVGLVVREPEGPGGFHLVVDRSGLVLARVRSPEHAASVALSFLDTFRPAPQGTHRFRLKTVVRGDAAVLAAFPVLTRPAAIERRLERLGYCVLDRFAVDITVDLRVVAGFPDSSAPTAPVASGHVNGLGHDVRVAGLLVPTDGGPQPGAATLVGLVAGSIIGRPSESGLTVAERVAGSALRLVDVNDDGSVYDALSA